MTAFLTHPELFPARIAGEPWGSGRFVLDLPGGPFVVTGLSAEQEASLGDRFERGTAHGSEIPVAVFRAAPSDFRAIDTRGWDYALELEGPAVAGMNLMARLHEERAAIWTCAGDRAAFWGVVENVLRPFVARRLLGAGGLLVHSAAIVIEGRGFLFPGASGSGKSTLAAMALAAGYGVLSDDLNAVLAGALQPLPFAGDLAPDALRRTPAPLHAIVSIEKGAADSVRPMSRAAAVALLVRSASYINRDRDAGDLLLDRAEELAGAATTLALTFRLGGEVWPILTAT